MAEPVPSAFPLSQALSPFKNPEFELWLSPLWNGRDLTTRTNLRRNLKERLHDLGDNTPYSQICSLAFPPTSSHHGISVSHTDGLGGFLISNSIKDIGLDIEREGRVTVATLSRVLGESPANSVFASGVSDPTLLWVALESSFKAGSKSLNLNLVSDIGISSWDTTDGSTYRFVAEAIRLPNADPPPKIRGIVFKVQGYLISTSALFP